MRRQVDQDIREAHNTRGRAGNDHADLQDPGISLPSPLEPVRAMLRDVSILEGQVAVIEPAPLAFQGVMSQIIPAAHHLLTSALSLESLPKESLHGLVWKLQLEVAAFAEPFGPSRKEAYLTEHFADGNAEKRSKLNELDRALFHFGIGLGDYLRSKVAAPEQFYRTRLVRLDSLVLDRVPIVEQGSHLWDEELFGKQKSAMDLVTAYKTELDRIFHAVLIDVPPSFQALATRVHFLSLAGIEILFLASPTPEMGIMVVRRFHDELVDFVSSIADADLEPIAPVFVSASRAILSVSPL